VFKHQSLTTPVKPVFDASCKTGRSPSFNECLEIGPNMLELIPDVLLRFRVGKYGAISNIRKAFFMIRVKEDDRDCLRFLWWKNHEEKKLRVFRHRRVVFGLNSSPYLLGAVIQYHLQQYEGKRDKWAADLLWKSLRGQLCCFFRNSGGLRRLQGEDNKNDKRGMYGVTLMAVFHWRGSRSRVTIR